MPDLTAADLDHLVQMQIDANSAHVTAWDENAREAANRAYDDWIQTLEGAAFALLRLARRGLLAEEMAQALDEISDGCPHDHGWQVGQCGCQAHAASAVLAKYDALMGREETPSTPRRRPRREAPRA